MDTAGVHCALLVAPSFVGVAAALAVRFGWGKFRVRNATLSARRGVFRAQTDVKEPGGLGVKPFIKHVCGRAARNGPASMGGLRAGGQFSSIKHNSLGASRPFFGANGHRSPAAALRIHRFTPRSCLGFTGRGGPSKPLRKRRGFGTARTAATGAGAQGPGNGHCKGSLRSDSRTAVHRRRRGVSGPFRMG